MLLGLNGFSRRQKDVNGNSEMQCIRQAKYFDLRFAAFLVVQICLEMVDFLWFGIADSILTKFLVFWVFTTSRYLCIFFSNLANYGHPVYVLFLLKAFPCHGCPLVLSCLQQHLREQSSAIRVPGICRNYTYIYIHVFALVYIDHLKFELI